MFTRFFGLFAAVSFLASLVGHLLRAGGVRGRGLEIVRWTSTGGWLLALAVLALGLLYRWWKRAHLRRTPDRAVTELTPMPDELAARLDRVLLPLVTSARLAGVAAAVDLGGDAAVRGYGDPEAARIDERTVFEIGSITKTFTALLLAEMVLAGEVSLEDAVSEHLPGIELGGATVLDLATHHAGLPRLPSGMLGAVISRAPNPYAGWDEARLESAARRARPRSQPGSSSHYSNFGFAILGLLISRRAGVPYDELVRDRICAPLQMNDTHVADTERDTGRLVPGHDFFGGRTSNWHMAAMSPCGGIRSTADDMRRYLAAQLRPGESRLAEAIRFAQEPRREFATGWQARLRGAGGDRRIGLAWISTPLADGTSITWHNGGTGGYGSFLGLDNDCRAGIVALTNSVHSYRLDGSCLEILRSVTPPVSSAAA